MENPIFSFGEKFLVLVDEFIKNRKYRNPKLLIGVLFLFLILVYVVLISTPRLFPNKTIVTIKEGSGLYALSLELEGAHVVRSAITFRTLAILFGGENLMKAGDYYLPQPQNAVTLAWRIRNGLYGIETAKITIPEGFDLKEISQLFDKRFLRFNHDEFSSTAPEGYQFPDTYFIEVSATASSTINLLKNNFNRKISPYKTDIAKSKHSLKEIITMASILEAEAKLPDEMSVASGILWKRIALGVPLQVDSATSTYRVAGLPSGPINNPGLNSIKAALYPKNSPYLYFLTDKLGVMHYAKTFDEHKANIQRYLK